MAIAVMVRVETGEPGFVYYKRPAGFQAPAGATLYVEGDYADKGRGQLGLQYSSTFNNHQAANFCFNTAVQDTGRLKTAVFRLDYADLKGGHNGGADLRFTRSAEFPLELKEARISVQPTARFLKEAAFLGPYRGPYYDGGKKVRTDSLLGKTICGYQGWFRTPGDDWDIGWQHYIPDWGGLISPKKIAVDMWPDMGEFTPAERHIAPGFTHPDGRQAELFSSLNYRTTLRHFQWMESWDIDGVALQRNHDDLINPAAHNLRQLAYVRAAANQTGRVYYVEYALKIPTKAADLDYLERDWKYLVDVLQITKDPSYLHHNGKPVVGVYGFFTGQIDSPGTANAVVEIFVKPGPYQGFLAGAGLWSWRTDFSPSWKQVVYRMGSFQPWNVGNGAGKRSFPTTSNWADDKRELAKHGVLYQPLVYPGGSADNRGHLRPGSTTNGRQKGAFMWKQFVDAYSIGAKWAFLAMFDELDEGTQILKSTSNPPKEAYFIGYEGLPSDCYLCFTGMGAKMLRKEIPFSHTKPDCAGMTQPSIPEPLAPAWNASLGTQVGFTWSAAVPAESAKSPVARYELEVDGAVTPLTSLGTARNLSKGRHAWRVRAVNSLGKASGWSLKRPFTVN